MSYVAPGRAALAVLAIATLAIIAPGATIFGAVHAALLIGGIQAVRALEPPAPRRS